MSKPAIDQLLIRSAIDPDLRRRLLDAPDDVFPEYDLSEEEQELLRHPDHRLLPLLGRALGQVLARHQESAAPAESPAPSPAESPVRALPEMSMAVTVVPCVRVENGAPAGYAYAVWVNPLPPGADPAALPPPAGAVLPGQPLAPLYAIVQLSALELRDAAGGVQVGLAAALRQSSNMSSPPSPASAGNPDAPPFGSDLRSAEVESAVAAVRAAAPGERYQRIVELMGALRGGEVR